MERDSSKKRVIERERERESKSGGGGKVPHEKKFPCVAEGKGTSQGVVGFEV